MTRIQKLLSIGFLIITVLISLSPELDYRGYLSFIIFIFALGMFIFSSIPAGLVAWLALCAGVLLGLPEEIIFESFSIDIVWLMIGAFIIAEVLVKSGLVDRLTRWIEKNCYTKGRVTFFTFLLIQILSVAVPSTSGRASAMLPVYNILSSRFHQHKKFFGIGIPVLILMGANTTLLGAGSHIIGIGILNAQTGESISYAEFLIYALPFGLTIGLITLFVLKMMYFKEFNYDFEIPAEQDKKPFTLREKYALFLTGLTILLWLTEPVHGFDIAFVTILMSLIMMLPSLKLISWKEGLASVSWSLIFFVAGAAALGKLLVDYGVTDYFQHVLMGLFSGMNFASGLPVLILIILVSVLSHLLITSHTTRAVVLIPVFIILAQSFNLNTEAVVFIALLGINFCVMLPVSSKALLIFYESDNRPFETRELMKIGLLLMPVYVILMVLTYYLYWQHIGLSLI